MFSIRQMSFSSISLRTAYSEFCKLEFRMLDSTNAPPWIEPGRIPRVLRSRLMLDRCSRLISDQIDLMVELVSDWMPFGAFRNSLGFSGDRVELTCIAGRAQNIRWTKEGEPMPYQSRDEDGVLIIPSAQPSDSGTYICTATSYDGTRGTQFASVTIQGGRG